MLDWEISTLRHSARCSSITRWRDSLRHFRGMEGQIWLLWGTRSEYVRAYAVSRPRHIDASDWELFASHIRLARLCRGVNGRSTALPQPGAAQTGGVRAPSPRGWRSESIAGSTRRIAQGCAITRAPGERAAAVRPVILTVCEQPRKADGAQQEDGRLPQQSWGGVQKIGTIAVECMKHWIRSGSARIRCTAGSAPTAIRVAIPTAWRT